MRLDTLEVGERFVIPGLDNRAGVVLHQSAGGTTVQYDGVRTTTFTPKPKWGDEKPKQVTITSHAAAVQISGGTEVRRA